MNAAQSKEQRLRAAIKATPESDPKFNEAVLELAELLDALASHC